MNSMERNVVICRACITECTQYKSIFRRGRIMGMRTTLAAILSYCTNLDFPEHEDFMPSNICSECIETLDQLYAFKQMVCKADETLRNQQSEQEAMEAEEESEGWHKLPDEEQLQQKEEMESVDGILKDGDNSNDEYVDNSGTAESPKYIDPIEEQLNEVFAEDEREFVYLDEAKQIMDEDVKLENNDYDSDTYVVQRTADTADFSEIIASASDNDEDIHPSSELQAMVNTKKEKVAEKVTIEDVKTDLVCQICNKHFNNPKVFQKHKHKVKNLTCMICNKSYRSVTVLREHMNRHTGEKPYLCDVCGKGITQISGYKKHMLTHTGEKPHTCDICGRAFAYSSNLIIHRRAHTGDKPHCCHICPQRFYTIGRLRRHINAHRRDQAYQCEICEEYFKFRTLLVAHQNKHKMELLEQNATSD